MQKRISVSNSELFTGNDPLYGGKSSISSITSEMNDSMLNVWNRFRREFYVRTSADKAYAPT